MQKINPIFYRKIPLPVKIKRPTLAVGTPTKNTLCFAEGDSAYLSQIHSDLNNPKDFSAFERSVKYLLRENPKILAYDLHPEYLCTKYATSLRASCPERSRGTSFELRAIQHHHSHIASCMADNCLTNQKVIGVAFDGTGLGSDNRIWGAEFFICDYERFNRKAHLKEIPLLGQDKAILEPVRLLAAWLYLIYKDKFLDLDISAVKKISRCKWGILKKMYLSKFNSPLASSAGRLFDAVASLVLGKHKANFEAELAIELEKLAARWTKDEGRRTKEVRNYKFKFIKDKDCYIINPLPMFKEIIEDLKAKESKEKIAYRFHLTMAWMIRKMCLILRRETNINKVVLSGGVFQNSLLLSLAKDLLYRQGFKVYTHKEIACNDSGISLGQAVIANYRG